MANKPMSTALTWCFRYGLKPIARQYAGPPDRAHREASAARSVACQRASGDAFTLEMSQYSNVPVLECGSTRMWRCSNER